MSPGDLEKLIASQISECEIHVQGGEGKYHVSIVGDIFDGLNSVKRQQVVYKVLNDQIRSGAIHAVTMQLQTVTESGSQ